MSYPSAPPLHDYGQEPAPRPPSMIWAVRLMYVGAVLALLGTLFTLTNQGQIRTKIAEQAAKTRTKVNLDSATHATVIASVLSGIIVAVLWFVMARLNASGRRWARLLSSVLALLNLGSLAGILAEGEFSNLSVVASIVSVALGVATVVLLWRPDSSRFYSST